MLGRSGQAAFGRERTEADVGSAQRRNQLLILVSDTIALTRLKPSSGFA
jgi:hypothetical protein